MNKSGNLHCSKTEHILLLQLCDYSIHFYFCKHYTLNKSIKKSLLFFYYIKTKCNFQNFICNCASEYSNMQIHFCATILKHIFTTFLWPFGSLAVPVPVLVLETSTTKKQQQRFFRCKVFPFHTCFRPKQHYFIILKIFFRFFSSLKCNLFIINFSVKINLLRKYLGKGNKTKKFYVFEFVIL